jgi:hypothetical protein
MSEDEPTTAAEMALMDELSKLLEAAGAAVVQERAENLEVDVMVATLNLRAVIARAEQIAALRQAKGRPALSRESTELLSLVHERVQLLRDQLEALYE